MNRARKVHIVGVSRWQPAYWRFQWKRLWSGFCYLVAGLLVWLFKRKAWKLAIESEDTLYRSDHIDFVLRRMNSLYSDGLPERFFFQYLRSAVQLAQGKYSLQDTIDEMYADEDEDLPLVVAQERKLDDYYDRARKNRRSVSRGRKGGKI